MATIAMGPELFEEAWSDLRVQVEQVGFFRADFDDENKTFTLLEWRLVPQGEFEFQGPFHVELTDEAQAAAIQWAWAADSCLVEAHSHDGRWHVEFSPTDLSGFVEWVPHVRWRLRGRPYGALVVAGDEFDGLAWIGASIMAEQIASISTPSLYTAATGRTLRHHRSDG